MKSYRLLTPNKVDKRQVGWIRIPISLFQGNSDKDVLNRNDALEALQMNNPDLYAKVIHRHLVVNPLKYKKEWLDLKCPPVKPEPETV